MVKTHRYSMLQLGCYIHYEITSKVTLFYHFPHNKSFFYQTSIFHKFICITDYQQKGVDLSVAFKGVSLWKTQIFNHEPPIHPGSRLIRIRHLRGFHSWVPFSFIHQLVAGDAIGDAKCKKLAPESLYSASGGYSI